MAILLNLIAFGRATGPSRRLGRFFFNVIDGWSATSSSGFAIKVTKKYCKVNKSNKGKSHVTLDKSTSLQVKVFSQNYTSLHANYLVQNTHTHPLTPPPTHTHVSIDAQVGTAINVMVSGDLVKISVGHTNLQLYDDPGR